MTRVALVLCVMLEATALAADQPVTGAMLVLRRSSSGAETLVFVSKDPAALFPAIGSADDPQTGNPGGALVELFSTAEQSGAALDVPPANWTARAATPASHRFANRRAPDNLSSVRTVFLKQGRLLKVVGRRVGLGLATSQGAVGIRITTGSLRNCALFGPPSVRRDQAGVFDARNASTAGLADCSESSLGGTSTTSTSTSTPDTTTTGPDTTTTLGATTSTNGCPSTTTTTSLPPCETPSPTCTRAPYGVCFNGHTCEVDSVSGACACTGPPPSCGQWGIQACGGTCPAGEMCQLNTIYPFGPSCPPDQVCHCVPSP
jgi:hypothetical protein